MKKSILIPIVLVALSGCGRSSLDLPEDPISFDVYTLKSRSTSKANGTFIEGNPLSATTLPEGSQFGIFGYFHQSLGGENGSWDDAVTKGTTNHPNLFFNGHVTASYDGLTPQYTSDPVRYWPSNDKERISFFAYYPYDATGANIKTNLSSASNGEGVFEYAVPASAADHIDFMISDLCVDQSKSANYLTGDGKVRFNFHHVLSQVRIKTVNVINSNPNVTISNISIMFKNVPLSGRCVVTPTTDGEGKVVKDANGRVNNNFSWPKTSMSFTREGVNGIEAELCYDTDDNLIPGQVLLMIPYNFAYDPAYPDAEIVVVFDVDRTAADGEEYHYRNNELSAPLWKGGSAWVANHIYDYNITVRLEGLEMSAEVSDWAVGAGDVDLEEY